MESDKFVTKRYEISFREIAEGGPAGYESTYLTNIGEEASERFYGLLEGMEGELLPVECKRIRQRNAETFFDVLNKGASFGVVSGFKPSGAYHFGHSLTSAAVAFFQRNGGQIFMPVADIEADLDTKLSKDEYLYWAADNLLDWGACGVDLDAAHVYLQSEEKRVGDLAYLLARGLTLDLPIDIYGMEKMRKEFKFLFAGITQVGDIYLPQHRDFGNSHSVMVSGPDQDGHMKMTIALVEKAKDVLPGFSTIPSAFYIPHIRGLTGEKASSSKPETTIYLGSGPNKMDLVGRIDECMGKLDFAKKNYLEDLENCALDLVTLIPDFASGPKEEKNNVEIVEKELINSLESHYRRRRAVFNYSLEKANGESGEKPVFWDTPEKSHVPEEQRKIEARWYNIIASKANELVV